MAYYTNETTHTYLYKTQTIIRPLASHVVNLASFSFQATPTTGSKQQMKSRAVTKWHLEKVDNTYGDDPQVFGSW